MINWLAYIKMHMILNLQICRKMYLQIIVTLITPNIIIYYLSIPVTPELPEAFVYPQELLRQPQTNTNESETDIEGGGETTPPAIIPGSTQWPPIEITTRYICKMIDACSKLSCF